MTYQNLKLSIVMKLAWAFAFSLYSPVYYFVTSYLVPGVCYSQRTQLRRAHYPSSPSKIYNISDMTLDRSLENACTQCDDPFVSKFKYVFLEAVVRYGQGFK